MIKKFNINGAVALYKREFADCLEACDYEGAIDFLLKYSEATENPDFHAAMGILYFLMTQDSDDRELLPLAFREFLMHLVTHPDSRSTYRNLLAVAILRRDPNAIANISDFVGKRGQNVQELVTELSEYGLDIFNDDSEYIDFDGMFTAADFGEIASEAIIGVDEEGDPLAPISFNGKQKTPSQQSKVIRFKGNDNANSESAATAQSKIIRMKNDNVPPEDKIDFGDMFDMMMQLVRGDGEDEVEPDDIATSIEISNDDTNDIFAKLALKNAQNFCISREYDKALTELDLIKRDTGRLYYCAECVRCNIMMELNKFDEAQLALDRAFAVVDDGALAGTLQCSLYEATEQFDKIPGALKNIDVTDYVDSDHVYRALRFALKYCNAADAMELLDEYIDEFNSFDLRSIHAQMLYNEGEREAATDELKTLSRILYDDFNAQYYYLLSKSGIDSMPLEDETPQKVLGMMVDNIIALVHSDVFTESNELIDSEPFKYGLEVFLTLEFQNTRSVIKLMFDTLRMIASDKRLEYAMRNALVSPYVEPLVKAVILGKLFSTTGGITEFLAETSFNPISQECVPSIGTDCGEGIYTAYALLIICCPKSLGYFTECVQGYKQAFNGDEFDQRDIAYFLWRTVKAHFKHSDAEIDGRVHYALGYDTKAQANEAYKALSDKINNNT